MSLINRAKAVQEKAYAPYSKFKVGSAVAGDTGWIAVGCNVENSSYPAGICAERTAITQAIAQGEKSLREIAIVTGSRDIQSPCGICLQVMAEFASRNLKLRSLIIIFTGSRIQTQRFLPKAFTASSLK